MGTCAKNTFGNPHRIRDRFKRRTCRAHGLGVWGSGLEAYQCSGPYQGSGYRVLVGIVSFRLAMRLGNSPMQTSFGFSGKAAFNGDDTHGAPLEREGWAFCPLQEDPAP